MCWCFGHPLQVRTVVGMLDGDTIYLTDYVEQALASAVYDKLEDGTFAGHIPLCKGVVAFGYITQV